MYFFSYFSWELELSEKNLQRLEKWRKNVHRSYRDEIIRTVQWHQMKMWTKYASVRTTIPFHLYYLHRKHCHCRILPPIKRSRQCRQWISWALVWATSIMICALAYGSVTRCYLCKVHYCCRDRKLVLWWCSARWANALATPVVGYLADKFGTKQKWHVFGKENCRRPLIHAFDFWMFFFVCRNQFGISIVSIDLLDMSMVHYNARMVAHHLL